VRRPKETRSETGRELVGADLIDRCKQGDERAWAELVEATHREVYTLCLRILRDPSDAADATQDAYVKAWRGLSGFRGDSMFSTWLYRIASNAAISRLRSRNRRRSHETGAEDEMFDEVASPGVVEDAAAARLDIADLEDALARLPEHYRAAVILRDVYGFSMAEVGSQLHISETAAKVRVHRGRKKLKEMVYGTSEG
jgi:RNA polymerase sigma-70 factor (ECF subfamily)